MLKQIKVIIPLLGCKENVVLKKPLLSLNLKVIKTIVLFPSKEFGSDLIGFVGRGLNQDTGSLEDFSKQFYRYDSATYFSSRSEMSDYEIPVFILENNTFIKFKTFLVQQRILETKTFQGEIQSIERFIFDKEYLEIIYNVKIWNGDIIPVSDKDIIEHF